MRSRRLTCALLASVALFAVGCGELRTPEKGIDPERPYRLPAQPAAIDAARLGRYGRDAPERTVLAWFGAMQRGAFRTAAELYAPALDVTPRELRRQRRVAIGLFRTSGMDKIVDVHRAGSWATVFTLLKRRLVAPNGRADLYIQPQAFDVVRTSQGWRLADNLFLDVAAKKSRPLPFS